LCCSVRPTTHRIDVYSLFLTWSSPSPPRHAAQRRFEFNLHAPPVTVLFEAETPRHIIKTGNPEWIQSVYLTPHIEATESASVMIRVKWTPAPEHGYAERKTKQEIYPDDFQVGVVPARDLPVSDGWIRGCALVPNINGLQDHH
jgi:hypothetical protein